MKKPKKIKTYTNDTDFLIEVYDYQEPNPEYNKFAVVVVDSCNVLKPTIKDKFKSKDEALKYAKELNEQYYFE